MPIIERSTVVALCRIVACVASGLVVLTIGATIIIVGILTAMFHENKDPSDAEMIRNFDNHESDFTRIVAMSNRDSGFVRIARDFTEPGKMARARWDGYKALFDTLGLDDAGLTRTGTVILLSVNSVGIVNRGSTKGFAYCLQPLEPSAASLDHNPKTNRHGILYRPIREHWYLSYDW
jgi:hypothetical protein